MCWQGSSDGTVVEVKSKCQDLFQYSKRSSLRHIKTQKYLNKASSSSTIILQEINLLRPAVLFIDRLVFLFSWTHGNCATQVSENIQTGERAHLSTYGSGNNCVGNSSRVKYLPGTNNKLQSHSIKLHKF